MEIENIIKKVQDFLKNSEDYNEYKVAYVLVDSNDKDFIKIAATNYAEIVEIDPSNMKVNTVADWAYSLDQDIFEELENGKEIAYMSMDFHYGIWCEIEEYYPEDIEHKEGMQLYINYCKENSVNKENIDKATELNVKDIMTPDKNRINDDNKEKIQSKDKSYIGYEEKVYNGNLKILETGFRKDEPIALVEKNVAIMNRKEYIVAFNYTLDKENSNLFWSYGYYYYDKDSGLKAYEKVINGGNLAHTFENRGDR